MLFNSYIFILLFLPLTLIGYYLLNHYKQYTMGMLWLCGMSFWFYGYFNVKYLLLLIISIAFNYTLTGIMEKRETAAARRFFLCLGLLFNLGFLFYFKYYDFFIENINVAFRTDYTLHHLLLPLGISFFTFQQLSYVIDCYKKTAGKYRFVEYMSYVVFFPQLVAGPIVLHDELIPQFRDKEKKKFNYDNMIKGFYAFSLGLAKKVLIADTFSKIVTIGYADFAGMNTTNTILVMLCYTLQIYFDFSGYCDMAYGMGYMFNVKLPINFNSPYKADSIQDFWDRWHMTLTRFFTRYVYIPLGGNRKGKVRTYVNTLLVFLVSGLWHGANWTFVLWGAFNGVAIVFHKICGVCFVKIPKAVRVGFTFLLTTFAWSLFRSESIANAGLMISNVFKGQFGAVSGEFTTVFNELTEMRILARFGLQGFFDSFPVLPLLLLLAAALFAVWFMKNTQEKVAEFQPTVRKMAVTVLLLTWSIVSLSEISEFLYFNF